MNRPLAIRQVARSLTRFKGRSVLGGLGIVVSVLATVFVLSAAGTVRGTFDKFIAQLYPTDVITVGSGRGMWAGGGSDGQPMRLRDIDAVASSVPGILARDVSAIAGPRDVRAGDRSSRVMVVGTGAQAPQVRRRGASVGQYLDEADVSARARVALVGATAARSLFGEASPVGATIYVDNVPFKVKGVLESLGVSPHGDDQDKVIVVPYTVVMESFLKTDQVPQVGYQVADATRIGETITAITNVMRSQHGITEGRQNDFYIIQPSDMQKRVAGSFATIRLFVGLICGAAFLISALVVMGVMQVSVRQRTSELGLRKAVGADGPEVRGQILWEALVIALAGCAIGAVLAGITLYATAPLLARKFGFASLGISLSAILVGVAAALVTGALGAWLPARKAGRLDPVAALRMR
jgi:ABC-type antimicrobial peptide transport system permease subunit